MKQFLVLILVLSMCFSLFGCKSEAAKTTEELIAAIGTVNLDSADAIAAAQAAYDTLSLEDKSAVENAAALAQATADYAQLVLQSQAEDVFSLIGALGEITADSEAAVVAAQAAYDALPEEAKPLVSNSDVLQQASYALKRIKLEEKLLGTWYIETTRYDETKNENNRYQYTSLRNTNHNSTTRTTYYTHPEYGENRLASNFFHIADSGFYSGSREVRSDIMGQWTLNDDLSALVVDLEVEGLPFEEYIFEIREEDGFTKLYGDYPFENSLAFVHASDVKDAFDAKYYYMEMDKDDYRQFFDDPVNLGCLYDQNGNPISTITDGEYSANIETVWLIPGKANENGLMYVDGNHLAYSFTFDGRDGRGSSNMPIIASTRTYSDMKVTGANDLLFVRADHVAKNYIDENGYRTLELTDGRVIRTYNEDFFNEINCIWKYLDADYQDYIY